MKKKIFSILAVIVVLAGAFTGCFLLAQPSPERVFKKSVQSVVEFKACDRYAGESFGTAVCISDDGKFVTNAHVLTYTKLGTVYAYEECYVRFTDEENYRAATLLKYDRGKDIAVFKLTDESIKVKAIKTGNSDDIRFGESVYAIGNGANYGLAITCGTVSMPKVNIEYDGNTKEVIQCDLTVTSGNSGGALLNKKGRLIGLTTFRTKDSEGNVIYGIVYCLPINEVLDFCNET